ncbi:MAG: hypothetical protein IIB58_08785 [Planctomycetes bacterium]|nr:hypothetical protein [Planctomycetota bacterium]
MLTDDSIQPVDAQADGQDTPTDRPDAPADGQDGHADLAPSKRVGTTVAGRYRLTKLIGIGGAGAVYAAEHLITTRVVAVAVHLDAQSRQSHRQKQMMAYIDDLGGIYATELSGPKWLRGLIGDEYFQNIIEIYLFGHGVSDADLADLARLKGLLHLRTLTLESTGVTDAGLASLSHLYQLEELDVRGGPYEITDAGMGQSVVASAPCGAWIRRSNGPCTARRAERSPRPRSE